MAFIRWKKTTAGKHQAYLIHSYRGEDGKPKHKMLAFLGDASALTPEHIASFKSQYPDLKVDWEKIRPAEKPVTDIAQLSDAELLRKMRHIRHERGFRQRHFFWHLEKFGLPRTTGSYGKGAGLGNREWGILERALERGEPQEYYANPEADIVPALRKAFQAVS